MDAACGELFRRSISRLLSTISFISSADQGMHGRAVDRPRWHHVARTQWSVHSLHYVTHLGLCVSPSHSSRGASSFNALSRPVGPFTSRFPSALLLSPFSVRPLMPPSLAEDWDLAVANATYFIHADLCYPGKPRCRFTSFVYPVRARTRVLGLFSRATGERGCETPEAGTRKQNGATAPPARHARSDLLLIGAGD